MPNPATIVTEFVLDQLPHVPVAKRIAVTRSLAKLHTGRERANLLSIANLLEDVERNHQQLVLDLKRRGL